MIREKRNARVVGTVFISTALAFTAKRSRRAVALLIFLSGTAGARIVAADLRLAADDGLGFAGLFAGRGGAFVGARESQRTTRPAFLTQGFRWLLFDDLQIEERSDREGVDAVEHCLEHIKAFFLVLDQRILLTVTDQADALLQMIERQQVILPLRIDDVEHDDALVGAHRFLADLLFLVRVPDLQFLPERFIDFSGGRVPEVDRFSVAMRSEEHTSEL